jgi:hypothetical protein
LLPTAGGGIPAQQRVLRARGRQTMRRLLAAGRTEFGERGFSASVAAEAESLLNLTEAAWPT